MGRCLCGRELTDGYHTMGELYNHRHTLLAAMCNLIHNHGIKQDRATVFKSLKHSDGTMFEEMFIVMGYLNGEQFSYHVENRCWDLFKIPEQDKADNWDGHTSEDVLRIIQDWIERFL